MEFVLGITWKYDYKVFQKFASNTSDKGFVPRFIKNKNKKQTHTTQHQKNNNSIKTGQRP